MTINYIRSPSFSGPLLHDLTPPESPQVFAPSSSSSSLPILSSPSIATLKLQDILVPNDNMEAGLSLRSLPLAETQEVVLDDDDFERRSTLNRRASDTQTFASERVQRLLAEKISLHSQRRSQLIFEQKLLEKRSIGELSNPNVSTNLSPRSRRTRAATSPVSDSPQTPESAPALLGNAYKSSPTQPGLRELKTGASAAPPSKRASWIQYVRESEAHSDSALSPNLSVLKPGMSVNSRRHSSFLGESLHGHSLPICSNTSFDIPSTVYKRKSDSYISKPPHQSSFSAQNGSVQSDVQHTLANGSNLESNNQTAVLGHDLSRPKSICRNSEEETDNDQIFSTPRTSAENTFQATAPIHDDTTSIETTTVQPHGELVQLSKDQDKLGDKGSVGVHEVSVHRAEQQETLIQDKTSAKGTNQTDLGNSDQDTDTYVQVPQDKPRPKSSKRRAWLHLLQVPTSNFNTLSDRSSVSPTNTVVSLPPEGQSTSNVNDNQSFLPRHSFDDTMTNPYNGSNSQLQVSESRRSSVASSATGSTFRIKRKPVPSDPSDSDGLSSYSTSAHSLFFSPVAPTFNSDSISPTPLSASTDVVPNVPDIPVDAETVDGISTDGQGENTPMLHHVPVMSHARTFSGSDVIRKAQEAAQARLGQIRAEKQDQHGRASEENSVAAKMTRSLKFGRTRPSTAQTMPTSRPQLNQIVTSRSDVWQTNRAESPSEWVPSPVEAHGPPTVDDDGATIDETKPRSSSRASVKRPVTAPTGTAGQFRRYGQQDMGPSILEVEGEQFVLDGADELLLAAIPNSVAVLRDLATQTPPSTSNENTKKANGKGKAPVRDSVERPRTSSISVAKKPIGWGIEQEVDISERAKGRSSSQSKTRESTLPFDTKSLKSKTTSKSDGIARSGGGPKVSESDLKHRSTLSTASKKTEEAMPAGSYSIHPPTMLQLFEASQCLVYDQEGNQVLFGDLFKRKRTLICFLRHWWCGFCQQFAMSMRHIDPLPLKKANMDFVIIGQGDWHVIKSYRQTMEVPFPIYADPKRNIYRALGMTLRTNEANPVCARPDYATLSSAKGILVAIKKGLFEMPIRNPGDMKLLGGDFILGPGLQCSFTHRMTTADGHMDLPRILSQAGCDLSLKTHRTATAAEVPEQRLATLASGNRRQTRSLGRGKIKKPKKMAAAATLLHSEKSSVSSPATPASKSSRPSVWGRFPTGLPKLSRSQVSLPTSKNSDGMSEFGASREGGRSLSAMRKVSYDSRLNDSFDTRDTSFESQTSLVDFSGEKAIVPSIHSQGLPSAEASIGETLPPTSQLADSRFRGRGASVEMPSKRTPNLSKTRSSEMIRSQSEASASLSHRRSSEKALTTKSPSSLGTSPTGRNLMPLSRFQNGIIEMQRKTGVGLGIETTKDATVNCESILSEADVDHQGETRGTQVPLVFTGSGDLGVGGSDLPTSIRRINHNRDPSDDRPIDVDDSRASTPRRSVSSTISWMRSEAGDSQNERPQSSAAANSFLADLDVYDSFSREPSQAFYQFEDKRLDVSGPQHASSVTDGNVNDVEAAEAESDTEPAFTEGYSSSARSTPGQVWTPRFRQASNNSSGSVTPTMSGSCVSPSTLSLASKDSIYASPGSTTRSPNFASPSFASPSFTSPSLGSIYGYSGYRPDASLSTPLEEDEEEYE